MQWTGGQRLWRCCLPGESADHDNKTQSDNRGDVIWWYDSTDRRWREVMKVTTFDIFLEPLWKAEWIVFSGDFRCVKTQTWWLSKSVRGHKHECLCHFLLGNFVLTTTIICLPGNLFFLCFTRWVASKQHVLFLHELMFTVYIIWFIHKLVAK